jgi:ABC-type nitrate/sulfonate/bicarbonate transport system permease component
MTRPVTRPAARRRPLDRWLVRLTLAIVVPVGLITLWWHTSAGSTSLYYPPLREVVEALREDWMWDRVGTDLVPSMGRLSAGYALAVVVGVGAGLALGLWPQLRLATQAFTEFLRALPPPLLVPFAMVTIGTGNDAKIFVIALGSVWPVLLNAVDGVRGVDAEALEMARSFGLTRRQQVRRVVVPAAGPRIFVGMRTALSIAIILMVISEMRASTNGLGFRVLDAQRSFDSAGMFAGIIVLGVVGVVLNAAFVTVERRTMRWYPGSTGLEVTLSRRARRRQAAAGTGAGAGVEVVAA